MVRLFCLASVTIGPNALVAAGAVVSKDVAEGTIVGGIPVKELGCVDELAVRLEKLPWANIIKNREGSFDPKLEPMLKEMRVKHFFGNDGD